MRVITVHASQSLSEKLPTSSCDKPNLYHYDYDYSGGGGLRARYRFKILVGKISWHGHTNSHILPIPV